MTLLIKNGKVWAEGELRDLSVLIDEDGIISGLLEARIDTSKLDCEVMDVAGSFVLPGGIDIHAHIQDGAETFVRVPARPPGAESQPYWICRHLRPPPIENNVLPGVNGRSVNV